ncbi:MAG: MerR family transcriptional regulator [Devosia sp.]|uniref:redox-sensitive transcriptional activator SoxR n=1 Tax=Devosia sp. TaxID=1871048 RepID=UPI0026319830|nr:redox-sensitive transcriptional activator SoxR [Devosia sp.]MDB5529721.1 MerR family transcriptional regulator [Devosia sp.]
MAKELTVGQVAERAGVAVSALHFYEAKGLIRSHRTAGNQRRYDKDVLRRVAIIRVAQELGISLAEVGSAFAGLPEGRPLSREDWEGMSTRWAAGLDARIAQLQRLRSGMADCIGCGCLSIDRCGLLNWEDRLASHGPGPRRLLGDD